MQYVVELDHSEEHRVELDERERGTWRATLGEGDDKVDLKLLGQNDDGAFVFLVDGEKRSFHLDRDATSCYLTDDRDMVNVNVDLAGEVVIEHGETERRGTLDLGSVESPITGVTVDVLVSEGDTVEEGDGLLIVEAMKMENTISAPVDGVVDTIHVGSGDRIFTGDELVEIERTDLDS